MILRECTDKTEDLPIPTDVLSLFLSSLTSKIPDPAALKGKVNALCYGAAESAIFRPISRASFRTIKSDSLKSLLIRD